MEFSRQADYAVRAVLELSQKPRGGLVHSSEIAKKQEIPSKYLPTIIRTLARAGLIRTFRGSNGGVSLAVPPDDISLRDVVEAVDGPLLLNRCQLQPGECRGLDDETCTLHDFWMAMARDVQEQMAAVSFAEMADAELEMQ